MMKRIKSFLLGTAGAALCAAVFASLGYRVDWPTFFYTLIALAVVDVIREAVG